MTDILIGRNAERARLDAALADVVEGRGSLLLLSGEAGIGKTRLADDTLGSLADVQSVRGAASPGCAPFAPLITALRSYLRTDAGGLDECGPLRAHLALLLPELGEATETTDRAAVFESVRCALITMSTRRPAAILLDDLQWSDETTLEFLATLAPTLADERLLVIAAYRSDELPRSHPVRRLRAELRRGRLLREISLDPLTHPETAALVEQVLGAPASARLATTIFDRTSGVPFFAEELTLALDEGDRLCVAEDGTDLVVDGDVPLPQTVRDAVLVRVAALSDAARHTADVAAVAGPIVDLDVIADLDAESGCSELLAAGLLLETGPGVARFRNPLVREVIFDDVPWLTRRSLHRRVAEALSARGHDPAEIAAQWFGARDNARALDALLQAIARRAAVHAHRDAARLGRQALDVWPTGERGAERVTVVEQYAAHSELAGDLAEAARAQREVVAARRAEGGRALADAERRIAGIYALQGDRSRALAAREVAAEAFSANDLPGEAAAQRLVIAAYHQSAGRHGEAVATARLAGEQARRADRTDLTVRALGLEGVATVKLGSFDEGVEVIRSGLAMALTHELTLEAAEVYQRLGTALEIAGDYVGARDALGTAVSLCELHGADGLGQTCLGCMAYVLRELGDWDQVEELCSSLIVPGASAADTLVADGILGAVLAWRGHREQARPLLERSLDTAIRLNVISMLCDSAAALAWLADADGDHERARELALLLIERWSGSEDRHYAIWGLRWAAALFARTGATADARASAEALSVIAASSGHDDALAALAHALGEIALADGDPVAAAEHLSRAVELHEGLEIPFERAQILLRAGVALAAAGDREAGLERLREGHRLAQSLSAAPLASEIATEIVALGASLADQLGQRAAADHETAGLSRRELEVIRLAATGSTNREIADQLVLSTRTIDMHMRNVLAKLRCRTRTEAARRVAELGLLTAEQASVRNESSS